MKRTVLTIIGLIVLIFLLDRIYIFIYPTVDLIRATLVGVSAFIVLFVVSKIKAGLINPLVGALSIFASAFISVLLIHAGVLVSQSTVSGIFHIVILAVAFILFDSLLDRRK